MGLVEYNNIYFERLLQLIIRDYSKSADF